MAENQNQTLDDLRIELIKSWDLERMDFYTDKKEETLPLFSSFISKNDKETLKSNENLLYYYQTHILPQPFFGNLRNPKVVILALNPKYSPIESTFESNEVLGNLGYENYIENTNQVFKNINYTCTLDWWKETFKDLLTDGGMEEMLENVAILNWCGYHSVNYKSIPAKAKKGPKLPTSKATINYVKKIIENDNDVLIIKIWGTEWDSLLKNKKYLTVNSIHRTNHIILESIKTENREAFITSFKELILEKDESKIKVIIEKIFKLK